MAAARPAVEERQPEFRCVVDTMFWGAVYGDLVDKYGIGWGLHHQLPEDGG